MKTIAISVGVLVLLGFVVVTVFVEREAAYRLEFLAKGEKAKALVLYHPSRDTHFSDDVSLALADGLKSAGFSVDRATMTRATPPTQKEYALIAVVSNTFWFTPDLPTLRYLARAHFDGSSVIGLMLGGGTTGRAQRMLHEALQKTGGNVILLRSLWISRPNDETRKAEDNRAVALDMAKQFGKDSGSVALSASTK